MINKAIFNVGLSKKGIIAIRQHWRSIVHLRNSRRIQRRRWTIHGIRSGILAFHVASSAVRILLRLIVAVLKKLVEENKSVRAYEAGGGECDQVT